MAASDIASLIARLEAAEGPITDYMERRDIAEMASAAGLTTFEVADLLKALRGSLDSALSLVPEGCAVDFKRFQNTGDGWACVWTARGNRSGNGKTVAIALCLAALKARAQG